MLGLYTLRELILNNIDDTFTATFFNNLYIISITVIQFIEEICLLSISKKFRKLVKKQFIKNTQTTTVNTIFVAQNSQQSRIRQVNLN